MSKNSGKQRTKTERQSEAREDSQSARAKSRARDGCKKRGSSSAAHMRSLVTIAVLKVPHSQQDAPSCCVLHMTVTCLCKFQRLVTAH